MLLVFVSLFAVTGICISTSPLSFSLPFTDGIELLHLRSKGARGLRAMYIAICKEPVSENVKIDALKPLAVSLDFLGTLVLDLGYVAIDATSKYGLLSDIYQSCPIAGCKESNVCEVLVFDDLEDRLKYSIMPSYIWQGTSPHKVRLWLEERYQMTVDFISTDGGHRALRWLHSKGNFKIVSLDADGNDDLYVNSSSPITHYTTAGHVFVTLSSSTSTLMQNKIDFPIDFIENVFVIPASVSSSNLIIDLAKNSSTTFYTICHFLLPSTATARIDADCPTDYAMQRHRILSYWQERRHSQIWVQSWALKPLVKPDAPPYIKFRLSADVYQLVLSDYLIVRQSANPESLVSTVFNQLENSLWYLPLSQRSLSAIEREVLEQASMWLFPPISHDDQDRGETLIVTGSYGSREYRQGAVINWHNDPAELQPLTAIVHILNSDFNNALKENRWQFEMAFVDESVVFLNRSPLVYREVFEPGEVLLLESARIPHGRSKMLKSYWFGNAFVHLAPVDWSSYIKDIL